MVAPNPDMRISPSGTLADGDGNGTTPGGELAPPLGQTVGFPFRMVGIAGDPTLSALALGPAPGGAGTLARAGSAAPAGAVAYFQTPVGFPGVVRFGAGLWLLTAQVMSCYDASVPNNVNNTGALGIEASLRYNNGSLAVAGVKPPPLAPGGELFVTALAPSLNATPANPNAQNFASTFFACTFAITPAMVGANGGPLFGLQIALERQAAISTAEGGTFDANSGTMNILQSTSANMRRIS